MKILVALNNDKLKEEITKKYKDGVYEYDLSTKEEVLEFLSKEQDNYIVITRDNLNGNLDEKLYVKHLKLASNNIKIVYIVRNLDDDYKRYLFANEVFNIIEGDIVNIQDIFDVINEDKMVIYRNPSTCGTSKIYEENNSKYMVNLNVVPKQIIAVYGTGGSGKSTISGILSKKLASFTKSLVSLVDMDIENPSIDLINNIQDNNALIKIVEDVDKEMPISKSIEQNIVFDKKIKNLGYITNNCSIYDLQSRLQVEFYQKLYSALYMKYEYVFINLPSSPFLDVVPYSLNIATKVFFVLNANYISIRQGIKYINLMTRIWNIDSSKIFIILNKVQPSSLDILQIKSLIGDYKILGKLDYYNNMEMYINGGISDVNLSFDMEEIYKEFGIKKIEKSKKLISMSKFPGRWYKFNVSKPF